MIQELPAPLVAPEVELTDFRYMPLYIGRLQKSKTWLCCKRKPELAFYLLNLWMRAWHEVPAASIEDDDNVLADAAGVDPERWTVIRDEVLRGWVKCSDGRLYHPVVAELAQVAWAEKQAQRQRMQKARQAKVQRSTSAVTGAMTGSTTEPVTEPATGSMTGAVAAPVTGLKGREGKDKGKGYSSDPKGSGSPAPPHDPVKALFDIGVLLLTSSGTPESHARSLIGKWRKALADDERLMALIVVASKDHKVDPIGYLTKAVQGEIERAKKPHGSAWI
jgi:uncharacterized protein YdaU (DUF1376 family)